jgi:hypothetical protein
LRVNHWERDAVPDVSSPQLQLPFHTRDAAPSAPTPTAAERALVRESRFAAGEQISFTSTILRHRHRASILRKVRHTHAFFPELAARPVRFGLTRQAQGMACLEDFAIWLNPHHLTHHTIAHELTHLLQELGEVPHGERSCDVFALARDPSLNDMQPNYLDLPDRIFESYRPLPGWPERLFGLARESLRRRAAGRRRYIMWFEQAIADAARQEMVVSI